MPSGTNTATACARPERSLRTMHPQNGPRPGPCRRPGSTTPNTTQHAATGQQLRHRPTRSPIRTTASQSDQRRAPRTRRATVLPHRHVQLPRLTAPAPGLTDPLAPCAPTPTTPRGAPVPGVQRHPERRPRGTIRRPQHKPNQHPNNATTHQPDRQYGPGRHHSAVTRPPARTRTRRRRTPSDVLTPGGRTRQAARSRRGFRIPRAGYRQQGTPRRRGMAERGHWQATREARPGWHPCQMVKPERRRQ